MSGAPSGSIAKAACLPPPPFRVPAGIPGKFGSPEINQKDVSLHRLGERSGVASIAKTQFLYIGFPPRPVQGGYEGPERFRRSWVVPPPPPPPPPPNPGPLRPRLPGTLLAAKVAPLASHDVRFRDVRSARGALNQVLARETFMLRGASAEDPEDGAQRNPQDVRNPKVKKNAQHVLDPTEKERISLTVFRTRPMIAPTGEVDFTTIGRVSGGHLPGVD